VAENSGVDAEGFPEIVSGRGDNPGRAVELLERAVESGDVVEADEKYLLRRIASRDLIRCIHSSDEESETKRQQPSHGYLTVRRRL
jgi:hypothetical protein